MTAVLAMMAVAGWVAMVSLAGASWKAIVEADATYANELYTPPIDQVFYRLSPINAWVLFRHRPPAAVAWRIHGLRALIAIQASIVLGFFASLIWVK